MAGLFDYEFQLDEIKKHQPPLQKLNEIIDWELFRKPIEEALNKDDRKRDLIKQSIKVSKAKMRRWSCQTLLNKMTTTQSKHDRLLIFNPSIHLNDWYW